MKISKNNKFICMLVLALIFSVISIKYIVTYATDQPTKSDKPNLIESSKFNSQIKDFKTKDEVDNNIKFKEKEPTHIYKNMKKASVEGRTETSQLGNIDIIVSFYKTDDNKEIRIQQSQDTGKPEDLLEKCKKMSIDGIDAWVYGNKLGDNYIQIMFWKDGMYYNVSGDIEEDELVKILKSLK